MNLIVAVDSNWAIGKENKLLVSIPQDMKFFRETTKGKVVAMGRKTLESFPGGQPLKNRVNVVLTTDKNYKVKDTVIVHSVEEMVEELKKYNAWYAADTDEKKIYLTFDAGYDNGNMPAILNALHKHQVHATFFVVGTLIREKPELIREIVDAGHTVGNHTMTHPDMSGISTKEAFQKQLEDVEILYKEATGKEMTKFYRPPQGIYSTKNLEMAKELGYHTFFWSLAYVDWYQDKQPTKEEAFKKLLGRIHPGAIVLLHSTSSTNAAILDELLTKWEEMSYRFGTLDELVQKAAATQ